MKAKQAKCNAFNKLHPVGSAVTLRKDSGQKVETKVMYAAEVLGGHTPVVWLKGISGAYALEAIIG